MGVTGQTLEHLKLLRAGGTLQRHVGTDDIFLKSANLSIPVRPAQFKRLTTYGLVERSALETIEEYQLAPKGHRAIAEHDETSEPGSILIDAASTQLVTTALVRDDQDNEIPYFLILDLGELTPRRLLETAEQAMRMIENTPHARGLQLGANGGYVTPIATGLAAPLLHESLEAFPEGDYEELEDVIIMVTEDRVDLIGIIEGTRHAITHLDYEELKRALTQLPD